MGAGCSECNFSHGETYLPVDMTSNSNVSPPNRSPRSGTVKAPHTNGRHTQVGGYEAIIERDEAILERDNAIIDRDDALKDRDDTLQERDDVLRERDDARDEIIVM